MPLTLNGLFANIPVVLNLAELEIVVARNCSRK